ncbi:S41 family peptidase [Massilia aerilata]|uniref:S41 family peptidase n=1 Tax=Massilia aerilata TaxID=453817 RepID=A0ABW0S4L7_9BURK
MIRRFAIATFCAMSCAPSMHAAAADQPAATLPAPVAHQVVDRTIELVESRGLYPRQQSEYAQARAELLAAFDGEPADIDRKNMYGRIRKLLGTLDTDKHSFIIPAGQTLHAARRPGVQEDLRPPVFTLVMTGRGSVLRWTPPAIVGSGPGAIAPYLKSFYDEAAARPDIGGACALVVDLSEQTGGNAWPPFVAMYPLFGAANKANWVDRDGKRTAFVSPARLQGMNRQYAPDRINPLVRFGSGPLAVVVGKRTASAGEMLLVALLGEERVQTFGSTSFGKSTANSSYPLADGSMLVLTTSRYALGDGPVYQGGIPAMHPAAQDAPAEDAVKTAAEWAAANSPQCAAKAPPAA